ncbi:MAG: efflux RND transporter periplasmic adaptor subunit [Candidatus Margulisbacteria bacterium]|nr:efflux RND transporter periplasmic adaptor subunit [Candidatus Margulisiibacteriota bacterium]MBU1022501.1 efflux RND transporter periplasmic adaptor subunit [Candidatus Margulisiibacteriota bacterium]MBU1728485.1 efflux RND transporter periplasmic adaptor subunit [Candidatus Margulisiibacteriota bacterium]MBU1954632.1 efflux RND transporter periplasmic adaptor subunit [Candidatus Margulisiibacteriota bacterium]
MKIIKAMLLMVTLLFLVSCGGEDGTPPETTVVKKGNIMAVIASTGIVMPRNRLEIKPPIAGRIESVLVGEGQWVRKGQILAWMSSSERAALLDAARSKGEEELKHWEEVYRPSPIMAPLNGFIIQRDVEPGQSVTGSEAVLVMADKLIVKAQVDETDIGQIKLQQKVVIALDAFPGQPIDGVVEHIAYESDVINNVTIYEVDVVPKTVPSFFRSGMSAIVDFLLDERKDVLMLPARAVVVKNGASYVFLESEDEDEPKTVKVKAGLEGSDQIEVISGVSAGTKVVIPTKKMIEDAFGGRGWRGPVNPFSKNKK